MTNNEYNNSLTIFFISYSVFEPVTNIMLKRFRPRIFIPIIIILWGICMTTIGLVWTASVFSIGLPRISSQALSMKSGRCHTCGPA
ncbi:hypothetical protein VTN31DRAFT_3860 [Thermomyces dupontii]|uniref:uncharacterized protein n=1 Tax=Talaromyces thermophilus TaxID=28565 RepID=UPI003743A052